MRTWVVFSESRYAVISNQITNYVRAACRSSACSKFQHYLLALLFWKKPVSGSWIVTARIIADPPILKTFSEVILMNQQSTYYKRRFRALVRNEHIPNVWTGRRESVVIPFISVIYINNVQICCSTYFWSLQIQ